MHSVSNDNRVPRTAGSSLALAVWDNEGGASEPAPNYRQYGRRIEADRSWTVYHVFTGCPAREGGRLLTGLSRANATERMLTFNRRNARQQRTTPGNVPT